LLGLSVPARRDAVYLTRQAWGWRCENLSELRALTCDPTGETALAAKKKATKAKRKVAAKRELIDTGTNKLFVRRNDRGTFQEVVDVGRSLAADRRQKAKRIAKPGQGDKGDRPS
jgi:hypothetical protein